MNTLLRPRNLILTGLLLTIAVGAFLMRPTAGRAGANDANSDSTMASTAPTINAALTVSIVKPYRINWPETVTTDGAISPWQEAVVSAEISGARLVAVAADVGDRVEKGQLLARFESSSAEAMLAQQQALLAEAEARLAEAEANETRTLGLQKNASISDQDVIKSKTTTRSARAQVDLAQARLRSQQLALDHTRIYAPDSGVVSARQAMLGAVAVPGLELFRLIRQNRLEWRAELIATAITRVHEGNKAEIVIPDGGTLTGTVRQVAPQLDSQSRTGIVYVTLPTVADGDIRVLAGMFASGTIVVGEREGMALPASSVVQRDGFEYVFAVDIENSTVLQKKITSGRRFANGVEILSGISPEDNVVETGGAFLNDHDRVRIVNSRSGTYTLGASR